MSTGKANKKQNARGGQPGFAAADEVRFSNGYMIVMLDDRRQLSIPLSFYPTLLRATPAQRSQWELIDHGTGIVWDNLDLQLCVQYLLEGAKEGIPKPPDFPELGLYADEKPRRPKRKKSA